MKHVQRENDVMLPLKLSKRNESLPEGMRNCVILKLNQILRNIIRGKEKKNNLTFKQIL